ncbi:MAG: molybdopterin cofactor-binding domain-containing protein, partial [Tepidisphaeraceae bacterium]
MITAARNISRRGFLKVLAGVGAGLTLAYITGDEYAAAADAATGEPVFSPSAFIRVAPDGAITVTISRSEMGQGVRTSLAMLVADELDADWANIHVAQAPGNARIYGSMMTVGSGTIRSMALPMRRVGAGARFMLVEAAAKMWGVDVAACTTEKSKVLHAASGKSAAYGELVAAAAQLTPPSNGELKLKSRADFKIIGKPINRVDNADVVVGAAHYAMDVKVDEMLYAVISRRPAFGATLLDVDDADARKVAGVVDVVRVNSGVAVLGKNTWAAMKGAKALKVTWNPGPNASMSSETIRASLVAAVGSHPDMPAGAKVIEATYDFPYLAHCTMEPLNAVADVRGDRCTIWAGSQNPDGVRTGAAQLLGIPAESITVNSMLLGGGFGRRSGADYVMEAVQISQKAKAPVKLVWTRQDDLHNDTYRTMSFHSFRGAVGADGSVVGWSQKAAVTGNPGGRGV